MGIVDSVKSLFSDPEENCYLNSSADIQESDDGHLELHEYAWIATAIAMAFSVALSVYLVYKHCTNYTSKYQQRFIVRILLMVPIYAMDSFMSFRVYTLAIYFDLLRDTYEAFVINTFFCLLIEYSGGYQHVKEHLAQKEKVKLIFPLNCISVKPKRGMLRWLKRLTLQYVVLRPLLSLCAVILQSVNLYCPGNWNFSRGYIYITAILFVSVTLAMYALIQFYNLLSDQMKDHKPLGKLLTVKFVVFLSFWQSIAVAGLVYIKLIKATSGWSTDNISDGVQNVLICGEMLIAAIVHIYVFSYKPYVKEGVRTSPFRTLRHAFNPHDIAWDIFFSFYPKAIGSPRSRKNKGVELKDIKTEQQTVPATSSTEEIEKSPSLSATGRDEVHVGVDTESEVDVGSNNNTSLLGDAVLHSSKSEEITAETMNRRESKSPLN